MKNRKTIRMIKYYRIFLINLFFKTLCYISSYFSGNSTYDVFYRKSISEKRHEMSKIIKKENDGKVLVKDPVFGY